MNPAILALLIAEVSSSTTASAVFRNAIIVGVNESFESGQPTLRYADDDAARYYEMFEPLFDRVELLAVLDDESQSIFVEAAAAAKAPDDETVRAAVARADRAASVARDAGRRTELYFVYVGHGRVTGGEGEVKLLGGSLARTELTQLVLDKKTHDRTHVIIDACNAYHLVNARGSEDRVTTDFDDAFERFVQAQTIDRFPTVGVVLSTSGQGKTLEWSRLLGGVFSHEVRSALTGAADANEDGRIDYTEVEAFLASANIDLPVLQGKPKVFVRAPKIERGAALVEYDDSVASLEFPRELDGHYVLEDDRGVRYAELNKALGYRVALRLVPRAGYQLLTRDGGELWRFASPTGIIRPPSPLSDVVRPSIERGGEQPSGIFAEPFGPAFVDGFRARDRLGLGLVVAPAEEASFRPVVGWVAVGIAAALAVGATWQGVHARNDYDTLEGVFDKQTKTAMAANIQGQRNRAIGLGVAAGVVATAGVGLFVWDFLD